MFPDKWQEIERVETDYERGRREAIEEAVRYVRKGRDAARTVPGPGGATVADTLDAAAEGIERHEASLTAERGRREAQVWQDEHEASRA